MGNPLLSLQDKGQSVWLDELHRSLITCGELKDLIDLDGVRGLTSDPAIFEKAMTGSQDYLDLLATPEAQGVAAKELYERSVIRDIQAAADLLHPLYLESERRDGYVSLEVPPDLAHELQGTLQEARRLWQRVDRENLMILVPSTGEGISALQQLISEGINVNATLLFSQEVYAQVAAAYLSGLESRAAQGGQLGKVASVASFFISPIDTAVDHWLLEQWQASSDPEAQARLQALLGKAAIACARLTYQAYLDILHGQRWQDLRRHGAQPQRLLWASTATQNLDYRDVLYVEELIGPDTVNTMSQTTLEAFRDHGHVRSTLAAHLEEARRTMDLLEQAGLPLQELAQQLLNEGLQCFSEAYANLLKATDPSEASSPPDLVTLLRIQLFRELCGGRSSF